MRGVATSIGGMVIFLALVSTALAQSLFSPFSGTQEIKLIITPAEPRAGETVRLTLESDSFDLDRNSIVWYANDKEFARGDGLKDATLVVGPLGSETRIEVTARGEQSTGRAEVRIVPVEVEILWNSDSYVPPFYRGRALPGTSGTVHAYALVRFQRGDLRIPESDIIYTWYKNGARVAALSGRGKSRAIFTSPARFDIDSLRVTAESLDTRLSGSAEVTLPREDTRVLLYEDHPLFGILFHRAIVGDVNTAEREQKVSAIPYFAAAFTPRDPALEYAWKVNDAEVVPHADAPHTLSITTNNYTGPATIELTLTNANDIFTRSRGVWRLLFGDSANVFFDATVFGQ